MASSNIKLFDENKGNMLTDTEFNISTQRLNGLQTGVASSQLQNKAMYQASLVAYAIAQVMLQNGKNANDTDAVSAFVANLSGTMLQKVYDLATTAEAQAAAINTKWMSPLRVQEFFTSKLATTEEAQAGVATGKWMSPMLVKTEINYMKATTAEAQVGTNDTNWMSPSLVKTAIDTLAAKAQNILSDATKALYGLSSSAVPNDVLALIKSLIDAANSNANSKAKIVTGSYTGTGVYGERNPNSLTFDFEPKVVFIYPASARNIQNVGWPNGIQTAFIVSGGGSKTCFLTWNANTLSWYNKESPANQLNGDTLVYNYVVIC